MSIIFHEKTFSRWSPKLGLRADSRFVPIPCFWLWGCNFLPLKGDQQFRRITDFGHEVWFHDVSKAIVGFGENHRFKKKAKWSSGLVLQAD
jgi:hypothetical protein